MKDILANYLGMKDKPVGIKINPNDGGLNPDCPKYFCQLVKAASYGNEYFINMNDLACPNSEITLGFRKPTYLEIEPRIKEEVKKIRLGKTDDADVVLLILNGEQVKRNKERFPEDFMFQLTEEEANILVSQNAIPSKKSLGGYLPYAFTEQGVAMLSSVLNSKRAILVNIQIMRAFTKMREIMTTHIELKNKIEAMEKKYDQQFKIVFDAIKALLSTPAKEVRKIGFRSKDNDNENRKPLYW